MSKNVRTFARSPRKRIGAILGVLALAAVGLTVVSSSGAATGPTNVVAPSITGTPQQGQPLVTTTGDWNNTAGSGPISYAFRWQRCNLDATGCAQIAGATAATYTPGVADVGSAIRSDVIATDTTGSNDQPSAVTTAITSVTVNAPVNTVPATLTGSPVAGQTLTVANGTFTGAAPIAYTYAWQVCDATGATCAAVPGVTTPTFLLATTTVGTTIRAVVTATNTSGSATSTTVPSSVIGPAGPSTLVKLPNGQTSIDATEVKGTARLILSKFKVQQNQPLHTRAPFRVTFTVTDTRGYVVRNAVVYVIGLPYNRILNAPEQHTAQDGTVTFTLTPTHLQPLKVGARLVIFARARVQGDNLLAGASTRRLVEVVFGSAH